MSYLNQTHDPRRRAASGAVVVIVHAAIGLALVFGLSVVVAEPETPVWIPTVDFTPKPPPTPDPTDPPEASAQKPVAPTPQVTVQQNPDVIVDTFDPTDVVLAEVTLDPRPNILPTQPPRPLPTYTAKPARPANDPSRWITTNDYPANPLRNEVEGSARYRVIVGSSGQVSSCEIVSGTGNSQLDQATCRFIARRARFEAATDETGASVVGSYAGTVRWEIPE